MNTRYALSSVAQSVAHSAQNIICTGIFASSYESFLSEHGKGRVVRIPQRVL